MQHHRSAKGSARRHVWLLWLVLCLPLGQLAAQWHLLSHAAWHAGEAGVAPQPSACDLCLDAATVSAGALPAAAPLPALAPPLDSTRASVADAPLDARRLTAYRSRAPPPASH